MNKFKALTSKAVPLPLKDVDTDMIIPAQFLTSISRDGFGQNLFRRLRDSDIDFPLNNSKYRDAKILVADSNFGCGSSREHAVWALQGAGFQVVIAKSFADIFSGNSAKNGLLLVKLDPDTVDEILIKAQENDYSITVNLEMQEIALPDRKVTFDYDPFRKYCLLEGLDDLDYILKRKDKILSHKAGAEARTFLRKLN